MLSSSDDLSVLDSVEVREPQENQTNNKCSRTSGHVSLSQDGSNVKAFLKRNAFVVLTMAAVALGKWFSNTVLYSPVKPEMFLLYRYSIIYSCCTNCNLLLAFFVLVCYFSSTALCIGSSAFDIFNSPFQ